MGRIRVFGGASVGFMLGSFAGYGLGIATFGWAVLAMIAAVVCAILAHLE